MVTKLKSFRLLKYSQTFQGKRNRHQFKEIYCRKEKILVRFLRYNFKFHLRYLLFYMFSWLRKVEKIGLACVYRWTFFQRNSDRCKMYRFTMQRQIAQHSSNLTDNCFPSFSTKPTHLPPTKLREHF